MQRPLIKCRLNSRGCCLRLACIGVGIALSLSCSTVQAQSDQDPLGQAVKDVAGGIANFLGAILNPNAVAFRGAVKEQRFNDALALYDKNAASFRQDKDLAPDL